MQNRVKELRTLKNLKQIELAEALGYSQQTISRIESGKYDPDIQTMNNIADFFEVSLDYLIYWVFHGGRATQSIKIEPPNPFRQSHAIQCSEPLNPLREPLQINEMALIFIIWFLNNPLEEIFLLKELYKMSF